ncbi:MAG: UbiH/UbiF/VisC/COQ6 family ubiquinone biosynthesis hydroxylase [Proteobacteria bacterium]|nr:UbiH/UbiF/VisC/COQ6 family ubiquinone biosynthesis hydroxylase [Pseudomonadota bacterium]
MTSDFKADVIIAGAGPNGLAMALALGGSALRRPLDVVLIDATDPRARQGAPQDTRGLALTLATQGLFRALKAWDGLSPHLQEMRQIRVTDGTGALSERPVLLAFATDPQQRAAAAIAESRHVTGALLDAVLASPQIRLLTGSGLASIDVLPGHVKAITAAGEAVKAPLIIGADGRNSFVRNAAGIAAEARPYGQTALTFTAGHELPHDGCAEEHFSPEGVVALLPLPGNRSSLVWGASPSRAAELMALTAEAFDAELNRQIGSHLGRIAVEGGRQAYPLQMQLAETQIAPRLALAGDAAHVLHPLAGLGLNLGFKDVAALADCIHDAVARGEDHGGPAMLERFAAWRRFDTSATAMLMDGFNGLFVNDNPVLKQIRDTGLRLADRVPALKTLFMQEASGLTGDLPRLMRGIAP